jgi:hypothetical protein
MAAVLLLAGCGGGGYREVERETGYKGKARLDPFLAAERCLERLGGDVEVDRSWPKLDRSIGVVMIPASMLEARGYVEELRRWVAEGGQLVCLFSWASAAQNEWRGHVDDPVEPSAAMAEWMEDVGWRVVSGEGFVDEELKMIVGGSGDDEKSAKPERETEEWMLDGMSFRVEKFGRAVFEPVGGESWRAAEAGEDDAEDDGGENMGKQRFASAYYGDGRLVLVADARPFRNRYIGDADHAALLEALADAARAGRMTIVLGTEVSFWRLLWANGWTVLVALGALVLVWLWRSLPRFGPLEASVRVDDWRDYRRHLDAVGGFFWRTDRGQSLLAPLRRKVMERLRRRRAAAGAEADLIGLAATIADVPEERVREALDGAARHDAASFTRVTGDLQRLLDRC